MKYAIVLSPEAAEDYRKLKANLRAKVRGAIEEHLSHEPTKTSKSRINDCAAYRILSFVYVLTRYGCFMT